MSLTFKKIIKNNTLADIEIESAGVTLFVGEDFEIDAQEYVLWARSKVIAEIAPLIASGDITINNGTNDLSAATGKLYIEYPDRIALNDSSNTEDVVVAASFTGNVTVTSNGDGTASVDIGTSPPTDALGLVHQMVFLENSTAKNEWLQLYGDNLKGSNETPGIVPWKSQLLGITFTNERYGADTDIEIHVSDELDGSSPTTKVYTWALRDCRVARRTTFSPAVIFEAGDKIGVYIKDQGRDPKEVVVTMYFKVIENNNEEVCRDYSGDFSTSGGGTTSS